MLSDPCCWADRPTGWSYLCQLTQGRSILHLLAGFLVSYQTIDNQYINGAFKSLHLYFSKQLLQYFKLFSQLIKVLALSKVCDIRLQSFRHSKMECLYRFLVNPDFRFFWIKNRIYIHLKLLWSVTFCLVLIHLLLLHLVLICLVLTVWHLS